MFSHARSRSLPHGDSLAKGVKITFFIVVQTHVIAKLTFHLDTCFKQQATANNVSNAASRCDPRVAHTARARRKHTHTHTLKQSIRARSKARIPKANFTERARNKAMTHNTHQSYDVKGLFTQQARERQHFAQQTVVRPYFFFYCGGRRAKPDNEINQCRVVCACTCLCCGCACVCMCVCVVCVCYDKPTYQEGQAFHRVCRFHQSGKCRK